MSLASICFLLGLPFTLSLFSFLYERFKNAHYVCLGAWGGLILQFNSLDVPFIFYMIPPFMLILHLLTIIKNEDIVQKIKLKLKKVCQD